MTDGDVPDILCPKLQKRWNIQTTVDKSHIAFLSDEIYDITISRVRQSKMYRGRPCEEEYKTLLPER